MTTHKTALEAAARAQCASGGFNPDDMMPNDGPRWKYYVPGVEAAITAYLNALGAEPVAWLIEHPREGKAVEIARHGSRPITPADVWETARETLRGTDAQFPDQDCYARAVERIARAILAERERAARVADSFVVSGDELVDSARRITAQDIARTIRSGK